MTSLSVRDMRRTGLRQQAELADTFPVPTSSVPKLTNRPSAIAKWITHLEQILISRQQQPRPGGDDREQITRARQAAEALFRSKPPVSGPSVPASAPADQSARKPRVLQIISRVPVRHEERETPAAPEPQTMRKIPRSQFVRIRTLVKYGMTVARLPRSTGSTPRRDRPDFTPGLTAKIRFRDHGARKDCLPPQTLIRKGGRAKGLMRDRTHRTLRPRRPEFGEAGAADCSASFRFGGLASLRLICRS
jgi:hypothetical protein